MSRAGLIESNQHANKWCCASETPSEFHRWKLHGALDNTSPHFTCYGQNHGIYELRTSGCDIYRIISSTKNLYYRTQEG